MKTDSRTCPECTGQNLFTANVSSAGQRMVLLPGLGGFLHYARFNIVVCADCGLTRFYAEQEALGKLSHAHQWRRL